MSLPLVAIVGRPNVGKSSLLNRIAGRRVSIVDPTPGVTRDRVSAVVEISPERYVEFVDTGGMGVEDVDKLTDQIEEQISFAINAATLVLFVVDAREGVSPLDRHVAQELRKRNRSAMLLANKVDQYGMPSEMHELGSLGFGEPIPVSATHGIGISELRDEIARRLADQAGAKPATPVMRLAVVGKRNAGKSTFINSLAGQERVIVSETPGTTRDSVDVTIELDGRMFTVIDTAGVRKQSKVADDIEYFSFARAVQSIHRADVVAFVIDASTPVSQVDKDLAGKILERLKPVILVVNKWDLAQSTTTPDAYQEYLHKTFPYMTFAPICIVSAKTKLNVVETVRLAEELYIQAETRVQTSQLNEVVHAAMDRLHPHQKPGTKVPRVLYASQISTAPPTIVCFVNDVRSFDGTYQRYLLNQFRENLPFGEVPLRLLLRQRRGGHTGHKGGGDDR